ncbi:related to DCD1-deoxycytidylate deaminase [Sporisorium reilianum f. sp. reilianum]|uniref:Deoxycytidylate deaminase n=1 Tax=Sporisorium reilianum f. sp. reilianum TaxID=72559 RepID=A0A2N8UER5_9BASI|nr:related to DCD1-deoxycytidylate deaminase [Sporisorium reilianum f. sp. reilianum]
MLIALIGPPGAGKASVAHYLCEQHGFELLAIDRLSTADSPAITSLRDSKAMLDYVTDRWERRYVTLDLTTVGDLDAFVKRPFFLCVEVGARVLVRWERWGAKHGRVGLDEFVALDDARSFGGAVVEAQSMRVSESSSSLAGGNGIVDNVASVSLSPTGTPSSGTATGLTALRRYVHLSITNDFAHLQHLHTHLGALNLASDHRLRPCWDTYFLKLCNLASLRSNCMKRRVGAVLVASNRILATGYNGTPSGLRNCNQGGCARCNNTLAGTAGARAGTSACGQNLDECLCLHAEENALLEAGRGKIAAGGATMYCNTCPCLRCAVKIIQTGIRKVVYQLEYSMDQRTKAIFKEAGVEISQFHLDA